MQDVGATGKTRIWTGADIAGLLAAAVLYYVAARFGMAVFSLRPGNITLLWLSSGIALVMCRQFGYRALPFIFLASFAANYGGMAAGDGEHPLAYTLTTGLVDAFAGFSSAFLLARFLPRGLRSVGDLTRFALLVCLVPSVITGLLLSLNLLTGGYITRDEFWDLVRMLILADSLGVLLVYPIYQGWLERLPLKRSEMTWLAGAVPAIAAILYYGFSSHPGAVYILIPVLLLLSFNVRLIWVMVLSSVALIGVVAGTAGNAGPFITDDALDTNFRLMNFVFSGALAVLGISLQNRQLVIAERSRSHWQQAAEQDVLTGLLNRRGFMPRLEAEHQLARGTGRPYSVVMFDLDRFKLVNDTYGHDAGDAVLQAFSRIMTQSCRSVDTVGRVGGEEFAILLPECNAGQALVAMERVRHAFEVTPTIFKSLSISVTVSGGIASFAGGAEPATEILARADRALLAAKAAGRNRIMVDRP